MHRHHRIVVAASYAALTWLGCVQNPSEPLSAEDRCVLLCEGNDGQHPCRNEEPADDCVDECTALIEPLVDDCLTCVLTQSGWIGESCECEEVDPFGNLDVTCDACSYTTHNKVCVASTACTRDTATCAGFELVKPTDSVCESACGD